MNVTQEITDILQCLGSIRATRGRRTAMAIALAFEDEDRLAAVSRDIYQMVGRRLDCKGAPPWRGTSARFLSVPGG